MDIRTSSETLNIIGKKGIQEFFYEWRREKIRCDVQILYLATRRSNRAQHEG